MKLHLTALVVLVSFTSLVAPAQQSKPVGVVPAEELKTLVPSSYFYRGKSASVQLRNSAAIRTENGRYILAGLVDTAGYASNVAEKYQGLFITEVKLKVGDAELAPGEYGFGFVGDKFVVTDVGANEVISTSSQQDSSLKHPVPLKITKDGDVYRLYSGRKYVTLHLE
jgi:hypothetical protein